MMIEPHPQDRDERVMTLAAEALKTPIPERDRFLQSSCQNDLELYRKVSQVVAWEERMSGFRMAMLTLVAGTKERIASGFRSRRMRT